jgi:hypothetical protein
MSPWADPSTATVPGAPYGGPPPMMPPVQPYAAAPAAWGYPVPYGAAPWGPVPPRRPQRPGQVITAAVLAFAQAVVVLIASLYVWFFASIADLASSGRPDVYTSETARSLATEGTVLAVVQLFSVALLVVGGVLALNRRTLTASRLLAGAHVVQVVLALYWAGRLLDVLGDLPGADGEGSLAAFSLFFLVGPVVSLGLLLSGAARRWFTATPPA